MVILNTFRCLVGRDVLHQVEKEKINVFHNFSFKFRHFLAPLCWRVCSAIASQSFFQPFQPSHNGYMYVKYSLKVVNLNLCKIAMNKIVSKNVN